MGIVGIVVAAAWAFGAGLMLPKPLSCPICGVGEGCAEVSTLIESSPMASMDIDLAAGRTFGSKLASGGNALFLAHSSSRTDCDEAHLSG